jgi:integrase
MSAAHATGHVKLMRRRRGDKFYAAVRANGSEFTRLIGPVWLKRSRPPEGFFTRSMAEEELARIMREVQHDERPDRHTFGEACAEWLRWGEQEAGWALTTRRNNRSSVNTRLVAFFGGNTAIAGITTERIDEYTVHALVECGHARSTVQGDLAHLSGIFGRAKRLRWITANPYDEVQRVKTVQSGDFNVLSVVEVEAVARATADDQTAALIRVAAYTGLRQGELRALRWRDVDFAGATIHVRRNLPAHGEEKIPKGKRVRSLPLWDQAAAELERLSRRGYLTSPDDRVFVSSTGNALDDGEVRDGFYAAIEAAGLNHLREQAEPIVFHDLRHTFGTLAVQIYPLSDVQAYMGHEDIKTTMIYVHHVPKTDAAAKGSAFIEAQMRPYPEPYPEPTTSTPTEPNSEQLSTA